METCIWGNFKSREDYANKNGFQIHTDIGKTEIMFIFNKSFIGPLPAFCFLSEF